MLVNGIIHVTGEHDTGKTTFMFECGARPEKIAFIDSDVKGRATVESIREAGSLAFYEDFVTATKGMTQLQTFDYGIEMIDRIPEGLDAIIWDGWTEKFADTFKPYVRTHEQEFRHPKDWSSQGIFHGAQWWNEAHNMEAALLAHLQTKAKVVLIATHLKSYYVENRKVPGVQVPKASSTFERVPRFRLWLRHNPHSPVPIGLVLKRLDEKVWVDGVGLRTTCILPRKITPNVKLPGETEEPNDLSLWDTIRRYYAHPFGNREPLPEETPNAFELSILDGTLTAEQKIDMRLALQAAAASDEGLLAENEAVAAQDEAKQEQISKAKEMYISGEKSYAKIAKETGLLIPEVIKIVKSE